MHSNEGYSKTVRQRQAKKPKRVMLRFLRRRAHRAAIREFRRVSMRNALSA